MKLALSKSYFSFILCRLIFENLMKKIGLGSVRIRFSDKFGERTVGRRFKNIGQLF